jgi:hypothetical protein
MSGTGSGGGGFVIDSVTLGLVALAVIVVLGLVGWLWFRS